MNKLKQIEVIKVQDTAILPLAWAIRKEVFVGEQGVDEALEYEFEEVCRHFLALAEQKPVGTARWRETDKGIKLERFAVLREYRGMGVGEGLLKAVLSDIPIGQRVYLHAQVAAADFYAKHGFKPIGLMFQEAGIDHYVMEL
jgi:predicted GNAT family N-acyltransferase